MSEGNIFSLRGGYPIHLIGGGVTYPANEGTPSQVSMGYPCQDLRGYPHPPSRTAWGTPWETEQQSENLLCARHDASCIHIEGLSGVQVSLPVYKL